MSFIDEATIQIIAGHGGAGIVSFRREAHVPLGGPDGGDGGDGGDVYGVATTRVNTLLDHRYKKRYKAQNGAPGEGQRRSGRAGDPIEIPLPVGTQILDEESRTLLFDLVEDGQRVLLARGGIGGRGNWHYTTPTRQAPRISQPGLPGEEKNLHLVLKMVADVGLVGLPNAGKSTLLRSLTNSRAKVGNYPFTTLVPNLGVYRRGEVDIVLADIPGLIEGAHKGQGLGDTFLKHIERTRVLLHLVSLSPEADEPLQAYKTIQNELARWPGELDSYPQLLVLNKADLIDEDEKTLWREEFQALGVKELYFISALAFSGLDELMNACLKLLAGEAED